MPLIAPDLTTAALRLIEFSEDWGVDAQRGVVMNSCFVHGRRRDAEARLWPQTERIKASCMAAEATGDFIHVSHAIEATRTLMQYFETPVRGLWRDRMSAEGVFVEEPVPASSLYHIVGARARSRPAGATHRPAGAAEVMLTLSSPAFEHNGSIPGKYTSQGENISPPLEWSEAPTGTMSFVLIVDDPDAPDPRARS